jgi:predicted dehydrogenase
MPRRSFVKGLSAASALGLGAALGVAPLVAAETPRRRRYAIIGVGARSSLYQDAIEVTHKDEAELVAILDKNPGRLNVSKARSATNKAKAPAVFGPEDFDRMIREAKPDVVIVTVPDSLHDDYIVRAMEAGCDAVSEKPMTTTPEKVARIVDAKKRTGRNFRVTHNYRYAPARTQIKDLLMNGEIGDVLSVDFQWLLNTHHGADYFRRWHSQKEISGGLMIHKASHHFDLVNWWLGAVPVSVRAAGKKEFYTPQMAKRMGLQSHHERCRTCPEKDKCTFYLDLAAEPRLKRLYLDNEHHDGYFRDRCVWRPDINIEDTMNVIVTYDTGATLSYSLNAFNSWEGYTIAFNGTKGRIEHSIVEQVYVAGTEAVQGASLKGGVQTRVIPLRGAVREIEPWTGTGHHAGGDAIMLKELFSLTPTNDKYKRAADERGGAYAVLIGAAANRCFETGQTVEIKDVLSGVDKPEYAPMPTRNDPVPMPPRRADA